MAKGFSIKDLNVLKKKGKIRNFKEISPSKEKGKKILLSTPKTPKAIIHITQVLNSLGISFEQEYRFHTVRRFRFDIAILDKKVAIEYEGLMSKKSRHTTITGYTGDAEKYNLAQQLGWVVLRYTTLNYQNFERDISKLLNTTQ